ncbi:hypothetical protein CBL_07742 [Carabus blaptoides fortunei]
MRTHESKVFRIISSWCYLSRRRIMESKSTTGQVEPEKWLFIGPTVAALVGVLAPAACITIFFGHSGVFWDFLLSADYSKFQALSYNARGRHRLLVWIRNNVLMPLAYGGHLTEDDLWRDGSILCSLINLHVPEACPRPQNHCSQRPWHGQGLAHKYLGITPIFTAEEFTQETLTPQQEQKFFKYLCTVHRIIISKTHSMKFSTDYVSRGMGLVIGQQCQKSTFYIYPIPKHLHQQHPSDIEVSIQGPYGCQGHIVIPSILHHKQRCQQPTDYRRSLYMTSKLNSISPTTQGSSFFRKLSLRESPKRVDPAQEIVIKVKLTETRAKVSYIPQKTGVYVVNLVTDGCHVVGSPHTVPVEQGIGKSYLSNDSDTESEEESRFVRRKKRIISRIVDFVDEKMLLQEDGTLVKIDARKAGKSDDVLVERKQDTMVENIEMLKYVVEKSKDDIFINEHEFKVATIDTNSNEEISNITEEDNEKVNDIIRKEIINEIEPEIFSETQQNLTDEDENVLNIEITETSLVEIEDEKTTYVSNGDTIEDNGIFHGSNNNLLDAMDMNNLSVNYNQSQQGYKSITPDILEPSNNNNSSTKLSETSTALVDGRQKAAGKSFDPTSDSTEVQDPNSVYEIMKTFSNKDPTKEESSLVGNYVNWQRNSSVNSLIKVFDGSRNDPDLVQCHGKPSEESISSKCNEHFDEKLKRMGVFLSDFDKRQRYLKSVLINQLNKRPTRKVAFRKYSYGAKTTNANAKNKDLISEGVVERQKKFWQDKFTAVNSENIITKHSLKFSPRSSATPVSISKETFSKSSGDSRQTRSFDGLVRDTTQIFETKSVSNDNINQSTTTDNEGLVQKCNSEGNMSQSLSNVDKSYQYASIEHRKAQLLKSYSETTLSQDDNKIYIQQSRSVDQEMHRKQNGPHDQKLIVSQPDRQGTPTTNGSQKLEQTSSVRRRARFKRAKLFFHHLERSQWKTRMDLSTETESPGQLQFQRCESAPCLDRQQNYTAYEIEEEATVTDGNELPRKISDRFLVDDLFRDILGDSDNRFLGIPNKMAVVASLASLDSDSSRAEFEEDNQHQQQEPKRTKKRRIPSAGFHEEYPHPPMTERWMYRSRSNTDLAGLIPRRVLLGATTNQTEI